MPPGLADHPDYEVIRVLGRGGMGVVYLVENKLMGRKEVLKVVGSHLLNRPGIEERFLREIRSAAKLHHTNIVTAYRAMRIRESIVFAMEYVDGLDLAKLVKSKGPLQVTHACNFVYQAALGLQHALEHGMVHRDIKPSNLMLARDGKRSVIKVLDFGLAKITSEGQADSGLTREGQMLGTPDYIAPEQIRDAQSADIRADVYSLGCTLYYLLAGRPPFAGDHVWDVYQAHFSMVANPLNLVRPEVPVEVAALVAKMMAKEPNRRFHTPGEVAHALTWFFKPKQPMPSYARVTKHGVNPQAAPAYTTEISSVAASAAPPGPIVPSGSTPRKADMDGVAWEQIIEIKTREHSVDVANLRLVSTKALASKLGLARLQAMTHRRRWLRTSLVIGSALGVVATLTVVKSRVADSDTTHGQKPSAMPIAANYPASNNPTGSITGRDSESHVAPTAQPIAVAAEAPTTGNNKAIAGYGRASAPAASSTGRSAKVNPGNMRATVAPRRHSDELAGAKSVESRVRTTLTFVNRSGQPLKLYWLNYQGARVLYQSLAPSRECKITTFLSHPWVVTDQFDNAWQVHYPSAHPRSLVIGPLGYR